MDILTLKINNFLSIGDAPELSLNGQGLVLVQGVNEDDSSANSNGVGKSSVVDALCWCLYGETARGVSGDAVVNKVAKKNCSVEVVVQDGATRYRITRFRKDREFKNSTVVQAITDPVHGGVIDISKGTERETQEVINGIIGCSLDVFMAAIYAGQEVTPDLPKMTDKQLKLLIEEAAGVERLAAAYEVARAKLNAAKTEHATAVTLLASQKANLDTAKVDLEKKKIEARAFEEGREGRAQVFKDSAQALKTTLVGLLTKLKGIDTVALENRSQELSDALAGHSKLLKKRDEIARDVSAAERVEATAQAELDRLMRELTRRKTMFDNADSEVKKACPSCGRSGDEHEVETYRAHLKASIAELVGTIKEQKREVEGCEKVITEAKRLLADYTKGIPDVSELSKEQTAITAKLREYAELKHKVGQEKVQMDRQNELAAAAMTETNPHESAVTMLMHRMATLDDTARVQALKVKECEDNVALYENVVKVFGPAGVRAHILDTVTPFLNDRTSDYLSALSDGNISAVWATLSTTAKGDLKEKFNIEVANDKGAESFAGLSGGEKRKVRLATMLALQDLVSSRATKPIGLWIGDEIDDALDSAGLERLMGILERKARERGTVLVVSHNSLKDWCDCVVTVTKRGGVSTIEGALCP